MKNLLSLTILIVLSVFHQVWAEDVPIIKYSVDSYGCAQIQVNSSTKYYYILHCKPNLNEDQEWAVSIKKGADGITTISEALKAFPMEHYRVSQHLINSPDDADGDGLNDMEELADLGCFAPLNPAPTVNPEDGLVCIPDKRSFEQLSYLGRQTTSDLHLKNMEYVKFFILESNTSHPKLYFMNTAHHTHHREFATTIGIEYPPQETTRGEIIYNPMLLAPNGKLGVYYFELKSGDSFSFEEIRICNEMLSANMPFLRNNLMYYPLHNRNSRKHLSQKHLYQHSRIRVLSSNTIYSQSNYIPLNKTEGYGLLKLMDLKERPNPRDIVLYRTLPNEMPRVGGIITSVPQTPLSHVNLRAIQDKVPNAFIAGADITEKITDLIGKHIYYKVGTNNYEIRQATLAEVQTHYDELRPKQTQHPIRDLSITKIKPLHKIKFDESASFGVKSTNLAAMHKFGFPKGTIPNGFAIPFYFYDEFMKHNNFYQNVEEMLADSTFLNNYDVQEKMLADLRDTIKNAEMPKWMIKALSKIQKSFSPETSIRCRSSTNNEDLPGFSGAGLYNSKTQKPDEGHISKSIKQVYASLWNFRAFDARQFYRIDHFTVAMGVLCHPNYTNERANGVGVSTDPIYSTKDSYYINTQLGEDLVTNPESSSIPEEILLNTNPEIEQNYTLIQASNLIENGEKLVSNEHLDQLREYLNRIENKFRILYKIPKQSNFAMEIEYKISSKNMLIIKQARPWIFDQIEKLKDKR